MSLFQTTTPVTLEDHIIYEKNIKLFSDKDNVLKKEESPILSLTK